MNRPARGLIALLLLAAAPAPLTTALPLDTVQRCMTVQLAQSGKPIAINTASGVVLDVAFQSVAADGKVAMGHVAIAIDDLGTQRRVTASAPDPADDPLAQQMLHEIARTCLADAPPN